MDYEKAYKEARERAKQSLSYPDMPGFMRVDQIFPELAESEDERIRKGLISHLKELREWKVGTMSPIKVKEHYDAWIAYLEKQKDEAQRQFNLGMQAGREEVMYEMEKEQNPAEWSEDIRNWKNIAYYVLKEWLGIGQYLDNPALDKIAEELQKRYGSVNPVSILQWSEEEERHLYNAIEAVKYVYDISEGTNGFKCVEFLKSFHPQPHWKPSKEQMIYLKEAINKFDFCDAENAGLQVLYEQLKKL